MCFKNVYVNNFLLFRQIVYEKCFRKNKETRWNSCNCQSVNTSENLSEAAGEIRIG